MIQKPEETTGFPEENPPHGHRSGAGRVSPLSLAWMTEDLLHETQEVWSRAYQRVVLESEAVEILLNVKHLTEVMQKAMTQKGEKRE